MLVGQLYDQVSRSRFFLIKNNWLVSQSTKKTKNCLIDQKIQCNCWFIVYPLFFFLLTKADKSNWLWAHSLSENNHHQPKKSIFFFFFSLFFFCYQNWQNQLTIGTFSLRKQSLSTEEIRLRKQSLSTEEICLVSHWH